jgi:hypothetical protein
MAQPHELPLSIQRHYEIIAKSTNKPVKFRKVSIGWSRITLTLTTGEQERWTFNPAKNKWTLDAQGVLKGTARSVRIRP